MSNLLSIGDFSRASHLTVKTLRFYHEKGILIPARVEAGTGYRLYAPSQVHQANVVRQLRALDFSVREIQELLADVEDEHDILADLESKHTTIRLRVAEDRQTQKKLAAIINRIKEERAIMSDAKFEIEEKQLEPILVAAKRMTGKYSDCGKGFGAIGKKFGFKISGKAMLLCHDEEYKETDADFSACMPVKGGESTDGIEVLELPAARCVSLVHKGPYETLKTSYAKVFEYIAEKGYTAQRPTREVYLKGPGMIFKGNPQKYLTEIQVVFG